MMTNILLSVFGKPNILAFEVHTKKFFLNHLPPEYAELDNTKEKSVSLLELGIQYSTHNKRAETDENLKNVDWLANWV